MCRTLEAAKMGLCQTDLDNGIVPSVLLFISDITVLCKRAVVGMSFKKWRKTGRHHDAMGLWFFVILLNGQAPFRTEANQALLSVGFLM